jgi:hypothetical protein
LLGPQAIISFSAPKATSSTWEEVLTPRTGQLDGRLSNTPAPVGLQIKYLGRCLLNFAVKAPKKYPL